MFSSGVKVLGTTLSPFVNRVRIILDLKSVNFEFIEEDYRFKSDLLLKSNPIYKKVPVLIHDDKCIPESLVIVQYIEDNWIGNGYSVLPSDPYDRAVARFWAAYVDEKVVPFIIALSWGPEDEKVPSMERLDEGMGVLEEAFVKCSKGKVYFGGDNIGYIDLALGTCLGWMKALEKMNDKKFIQDEKTPGLVGWADKFLANDVVKNFVEEPEVYVEVLKKVQAARAKAA